MVCGYSEIVACFEYSCSSSPRKLKKRSKNLSDWIIQISHYRLQIRLGSSSSWAASEIFGHREVTITFN